VKVRKILYSWCKLCKTVMTHAATLNMFLEKWKQKQYFQSNYYTRILRMVVTTAQSLDVMLFNKVLCVFL